MVHAARVEHVLDEVVGEGVVGKVQRVRQNLLWVICTSLGWRADCFLSSCCWVLYGTGHDGGSGL